MSHRILQTAPVTATSAATAATAAQGAQRFSAPHSCAEFFMSTGFVGWLLVMVAVVGVVVAISRRMRLQMACLAPPGTTAALEAAVRARDAAAAAKLQRANPTVVGALVAAALAAGDASTADALANLDRAAARETLRLGNRVSDVVRLGVVVLLLGCFGTVAGLIASFAMLSSLKDPTAAQFAIGLCESLVSTAIGLAFSLVLFGAFFLLDRLLTRRMLDVCGVAEEILKVGA